MRARPPSAVLAGSQAGRKRALLRVKSRCVDAGGGAAGVATHVLSKSGVKKAASAIVCSNLGEVQSLAMVVARGPGEEANAMSARDEYPIAVPCRMETLQPDPRAALDFHGALFGWDYSKLGAVRLAVRAQGTRCADHGLPAARLRRMSRP